MTLYEHCGTVQFIKCLLNYCIQCTELYTHKMKKNSRLYVLCTDQQKQLSFQDRSKQPIDKNCDTHISRSLVSEYEKLSQKTSGDSTTLIAAILNNN